MGRCSSPAKSKLVVTARRDGFFVVDCQDGGDVAALFQSHGTLPLPPYLDRAVVAPDLERYQTVYASVDGAVAAADRRITFRPGAHRPVAPGRDRLGHNNPPRRRRHLSAGSGRGGRIPTECTANGSRLNNRHATGLTGQKALGGRIISVGTTVVRALESAAQANQSGRLDAFSGDTELFIRPGYRFRVVDALITNFHLPRSTLLMMVCAFAGYEKIMQAYRYAIDHDFRFYSYGDAMFVERQRQ